MARTDKKVENQHHVPKLLLRNFACKEKKGKFYTYAFDKHQDKPFGPVEISNILAEKGFYDLDIGDGAISMEHSLSDLETQTANVIKDILAEEKLSNSEKEKSWLSVFIAAQFLRTVIVIPNNFVVL